MIPLSRAGGICFGAAGVASGSIQLVTGGFVRLFAPIPVWLGPAAGWSAGTGVVMLLIGGCILCDYRAKPAALLAAALLLAAFVVKGVPDILSGPRTGFLWTNPAKMLALVGGALVLAGRGEKWLAPGLLAVFLVICGAQHFVYAGFVDTLVPAWLPPGQRFWTLFAAVALLAGGVGIFLPRTRRLAGWWSGVMIFSWVFLVHLPLAAKAKNAAELSGVFEALAIAGTAWLIAVQAAPRNK